MSESNKSESLIKSKISDNKSEEIKIEEKKENEHDDIQNKEKKKIKKFNEDVIIDENKYFNQNYGNINAYDLDDTDKKSVQIDVNSDNIISSKLSDDNDDECIINIKKNKNKKNLPKENNNYRYSNISNPPKYNSNENKGNNNNLEKSEDRELNTNNPKGSIKNQKPDKKNIEFSDLIFERLDYNGFQEYESKNKDGKNNIKLIFSMFKTIVLNNNTLAFTFIPDENDFLIKYSVLIMALILYILFNIIFMTNNLSLHLYKDRDKYLHENLNGKKFASMNILLPIIVYISVLFIRKNISVKEFLKQKEYELKLIRKNSDIDPKEILKLHSLQTSISKFKNKNQKMTKYYFYAGLGFLLFTWYLIICFCGIYENSLDCLTVNITMSIVFGLIITLFFFFISSLLRIVFKNKNAFAISTLFNPTKLLYGEIKTNYPSKETNE